MLVVIGMFSAAHADPLKIVMPTNRSGLDVRDDYPIRLLKAALTHAKVDFELTRSSRPMTQGRAIRQIKSREEINLMWTMTSTERESEMLPIRIPIFKGLIGWRIFLIHEDNQAIFDKIKTEEELRSLVLVQGHDWPDLDIVRANNFRASQSAQYDALFEMLVKKRVHYFPRSVREIWEEYNQRRELKIAVEEKWAMRYPTAAYYFVNKEDVELAKTIEKSLRAIISDGKFDQIFLAEHKQYLEKAQFSKRKVVSLENPLLPPSTPVNDKSLWY